jgi:hypothetical protein
MKKLSCATAVCVLVLWSVVPRAFGADPIVLERVSGRLDYQRTVTGNRVPVTGQLTIQPHGFAYTQARSMAAVDLPDSSVVSIGASSQVGLESFDRTTPIASATIRIDAGAIHFSVRHPAGAHSNYTFITPVSEIAIRGTEGVIVTRGDETIVACVHGTNNDTLVVYGRNEKMYVPVGMTVRIRGRLGGASTMSMRRGVAGPEFDQFKTIIAHNHAMRMRGLQK